MAPPRPLVALDPPVAELEIAAAPSAAMSGSCVTITTVMPARAIGLDEQAP